MKKVLVAILAVALVLSALVVPAFALEASEPVLSDGILTENELLSLTDMGSNTSVNSKFSNFPETAFIKFEPTNGNGWINLGTVDLSKYVSMTYEATGSTIDWHSRTDIDNGEHYITFCSDAEGNDVLFRVHLGVIDSKELTVMTADLTDINYTGNLYMHIKTQIGGRYYGITNMQFQAAEPVNPPESIVIPADYDVSYFIDKTNAKNWSGGQIGERSLVPRVHVVHVPEPRRERVDERRAGLLANPLLHRAVRLPRTVHLRQTHHYESWELGVGSCGLGE